MIVLIIFGLLMFGLCIWLVRKGNKMEREVDDEYVYIEEKFKDVMTCEEECSCEEIDLKGIDKPIPQKKLKEWR